MSTDCRAHKLVADIALFAGDQVLLVRYKDVSRYDGQRGWFLPDDYLRHGEHPDAAAKRIAREQAGVEVSAVGLRDIESFADGAWHLIFHYRADLPRSKPVEAAGNVAAANWFGLAELPEPKEVAHDGWALDVLKKMGADERPKRPR